jgi:HEAT repeat protein
VIWNAGELEVVIAREALVEIAKNQDERPTVRAEAAVALGKLGSVERSRKVLEAIVASEDEPEVVIGALRGIALMKSQLSTEVVLARAKSDLNSEIGANALFALRQLQDPDIREWLRSELDEDHEKTTRCALMDTLKLVASDDDVTWARLRFAREPKEVGCDPVIWEERNERQHYILYGDSFRVKFLKIVANASGVEQEAWFQRIVADPNEPWRVREVANEVVLGIKRARGEL